MSKVYVVMCSIDHGDDATPHQENLIAYLDEDKAEKVCKALNTIADSYRLNHSKIYNLRYKWRREYTEKNPIPSLPGLRQNVDSELRAKRAKMVSELEDFINQSTREFWDNVRNSLPEHVKPFLHMYNIVETSDVVWYVDEVPLAHVLA